MDQQLRRLQLTELKILDVVDEFCRENSIQYSLSYGTLIGAVRHQGFIPWDDDVDLMMVRSEYDRFISLWQKNPPEGYFLQTDETDPPYGNSFLKIRKDHTTFIQEESEKHLNYHTGISIDIFPVDRLAPEGKQRKLQFLACELNMLLTRNYLSGWKGAYGIFEKLLLGLPDSIKHSLKQRTYQYKTKWNKQGNERLQLFWNGTMYGARTYFISDLFDKMTELPFEGNFYPAFEKYDRFLTDYFGDYMKLPPEEDRVNHHPLVIDFEHDYKEIKEKNA